MIIEDTELSGLDAERNSLVSIGGIDLDNPQNQFYGECRVREGSQINQEGIDVAGFTKEQVTDPSKQAEGELVKKFIEWALTCKEHTLAGQNPYLDTLFMRNAVKRNNLNWGFPHRTIDVHTLCYVHMAKRGITPPVVNKGSGLSSKEITNYIGIPLEPYPHNALNGAKQSAEAISRLLYNKKLLPEFDKYPIPWI